MNTWSRRLLSAVAILSVVAVPGWASPFLHGPYSGAPTEDSIAISWSASAPLSGRIEYGPRTRYESGGDLSESVDVAAPDGDPPQTVHVLLEDLHPQTEYVYRVVLVDGDAEAVSPAGSFRTRPNRGEPVAFAVLADSQWQWEGINRLEWIADEITADSTPFDFILHAGDVVESPASTYWDHWFSSFDDMLLRAPFLPVLGNHERNDRSYYETFVLPPGGGHLDERWWAFHWGDVVVVGLDTNVRKAFDIIAQQDWAREHLAGSELHKFVIFHHPVFSSDAYHGSGYGYDLIYHPIFVETGVDVVFNGHAHNYERIEQDGVTYLVVGGGGATPRELAEERVSNSVVAVEGHYFYARVNTSSDEISVDVVSVAREWNGPVTPTPDRLLDTFVLPVREPKELSVAVFPWLLLAAGLAGTVITWLLIRTLAR
jgi:predicted phosphodiesterase